MSIRAPDICDADELVARAAAMRDTLRARQAECEALGRLPDATNREYVEAGFFRVLQPRRFGGLELGLQAFLRVAVELSRGCPSSGWVYALTAGHAHTVTMWPEQGQIELFGDGDFRCPLSNLPARAVRVDGGYRIDGWWDYGSGCDTATHFIGGIAVAGADGEAPATPAGRRSRARPTRSSTTGTRSACAAPARGASWSRTSSSPSTTRWPRPTPSARCVEFPGRDVHENPIYRGGTIMPLLVSEPAAVAVGIAQGAIDHYVEILQTRRQYGPADAAAPRADDVPARPRPGHRAGRHRRGGAHAGGHHVDRAGPRRRRARHRGRPTRTSGGCCSICQQIVELCAEAVDVVFRTAGTTATRKGEAVERCFRDVNMIRTHVTMQFDRTFENVGQMRLGLPPAGFF